MQKPNIREVFRNAFGDLLKKLPPEDLLEALTVEQRLQGLSPKERLKGVRAEDRLKDMKPEEMDQLRNILRVDNN